jgi:hypothetical protein
MAKYRESIFQAAGHCLEGAIMDKASVEIDFSCPRVLLLARQLGYPAAEAKMRCGCAESPMPLLRNPR